MDAEAAGTRSVLESTELVRPEEENTWREQELGVERKKDVGEKRVRDRARGDVNVGGRKALFNSKTPKPRNYTSERSKRKVTPNSSLQDKTFSGLISAWDTKHANMAFRPPAQPFCTCLG
jgi:hypothetical protein